MYCPKCGKEQKEGAKFCPQCGAPVAAGTQKPRENFQTAPEEPSPGNGKSKTALIVTLIGIFLVVLLVAAGIVLYKGPSESKPDKENLARESKSGKEINADEMPSIEESKTAIQAAAQPSAETTAPYDAMSNTPAAGAGLSNTPNSVTYGGSMTGLLVPQSSVDMTGLFKLGYSSCGESSHVQQQNNINNTAKVAMDDNEITSWQEGAAGSGINEWVSYEFDASYEIRYVSLKLGNWRNDHYYYANNRPRRLKISVGGYETEVEFPAEKAEYWVELSPAGVGRQIIISIEDVYRGTGEYDDTCIAEIGVYGK